MFRKMLFGTVLGAVALVCSMAQAADDARSNIHITANIPNKQFHVQPRNPDFGKDEVMHYNALTYKLTPVRETFDVKNTDGSIHAYIENGAEGTVHLSNGSEFIGLAVVFNDVLLNGQPKEVVDDASSTPGTQAQMLILQRNTPTRPFAPGLYTADITLIFDAVPRVPF